MKRRKFIQKTVSAAASAAVLAHAPMVFARKKYHLRVLGTHVTLQEELRQQAQKDLGIDISFYPGGSAEVLHRASTQPESFDLYEQWSNSIGVLWSAGAIQPIEKKRIRFWKEVNSLTKTGKLTSDATFGKGDAPYRFLYAQRNGDLGQRESDQISFLPYVHNVDSIGYDSSVIPKGVPYETESWGWLFDEAYRGRVALVNAPTIGLFDAALAAQATGKVQFKDIGAITKDEMDELFQVLLSLKQKGHFRGVWSSVPQSVEFMQNDEVAVQSMFSPGVAALQGEGVPCVYAAPKEGYRAWHGVMCLSSKSKGTSKDAAYEYMNWWLSGWPGAFIARQGYYISTPQLSKQHLSEDEWNYWYSGLPTKTALKNTAGKISVHPGQSRTGGAYENRFSHVAVWNTVMNTYEYSLSRWNEFLLA